MLSYPIAKSAKFNFVFISFSNITYCDLFACTFLPGFQIFFG